jgi:hypothetical protein
MRNRSVTTSFKLSSMTWLRRQRRESWVRAASVLAVIGAVALLFGCSGSSKLPVPSVLNVNSSTNPSSPVGLPLEINGSGFLSSPGQVVFTQSSTGIKATVVPNAAGWSDTGIAVNVPAGDGTSSFTLPGTIAITVVTKGGTSNAVNVDLVQTLTFDVNNVTWSTTSPLPSALTGARAVAVPVNDTSAYVVVAGGYDGTGNTSNVFSNTIAADGTMGANWQSITTAPLPQSRAHHGMAEADPGNSLVPVGKRFIYVVGGQENSTDTPGGTNTVLMASVDPTTGGVGTWTQLPTNLPESLVGPAVAIFNGHIYVVGGLRPDGTPSPNVYSAQVNSDGTLGAWTTSPNPYPVGISFATAFGFAGKLYVLDGDTNSSIDPNQQSSSGVKDVRFASAHNGVVGNWTATSQTIKSRDKHITWTAFGQVIDAEGVYPGSPGSMELERSVVQPDNTLASFNGITSSANQINANVYNAAVLVSPLQSPTATPRFLLLGGQTFAATPPGALSSTVYYNNAP